MTGHRTQRGSPIWSGLYVPDLHARAGCVITDRRPALGLPRPAPKPPATESEEVSGSDRATA